MKKYCLVYVFRKSFCIRTIRKRSLRKEEKFSLFLFFSPSSVSCQFKPQPLTSFLLPFPLKSKKKNFSRNSSSSHSPLLSPHALSNPLHSSPLTPFLSCHPVPTPSSSPPPPRKSTTRNSSSALIYRVSHQDACGAPDSLLPKSPSPKVFFHPRGKKRISRPSIYIQETR